MKLSYKNKTILYFEIVFAFIVFSLNVTFSFCDVGNCVRYEVELFLDDGSQLTGFIQIASYDPMIELDDSLFSAYLKEDLRRKKQESFTLYKKIQTIEFPKLEYQTYGFKFSAAVKEDIAFVNSGKIENIRLLDICGCEHGDFSEIKRRTPKDAFLINYHHWIIDELTQSEIDMLQTKPELMISRESPLSVGDIDRLFVLCYDESVSESELNELGSRLFLNISDVKVPQKDLYEKRIQHYNKVKEELRKKKIIAVIIKGYN
jgi:hypothetical protein